MQMRKMVSFTVLVGTSKFFLCNELLTVKNRNHWCPEVTFLSLQITISWSIKSLNIKIKDQLKWISKQFFFKNFLEGLQAYQNGGLVVV